MEDEKTYEELVNWKFSCKTKSEHFARIAYIKQIYDRQAMIGEAEMRGEERGREKARQDGRVEVVKEIAFKMWQMGMEIEVISEATGLSKETISEIVKQG